MALPAPFACRLIRAWYHPAALSIQHGKIRSKDESVEGISSGSSHGAAVAVLAATPPRESAQQFAEPTLVKGSPTNLRFFDVSWNDNSKQRYYLADRTNNAIDLVDSATDTFLGFIGKGHYTGSRACSGDPKELRLCAGPNGVVTDDLGHVWSGDGDANIIEADDKPGTTIIRSIATGGKGRIDELAYDPIDRILMAENDGDSPPYVIFVSVPDGSVLGRYVYPKSQDGMEQPAWVRETDMFYQNVPGTKNRLDVFDPHHLPNPVKSFPVDCTGGLLGLTLSGLTVGPNGRLMTVCGSVGGVSIDAKTGKVGKPIREGADRMRCRRPGIRQLLFLAQFQLGGGECRQRKVHHVHFAREPFRCCKCKEQTHFRPSCG